MIEMAISEMVEEVCEMESSGGCGSCVAGCFSLIVSLVFLGICLGFVIWTAIEVANALAGA